MEKTTPPERAKSALAIGINLAALLKKGEDCGELVLPSLPKLAQRTEEGEELVCGTMNKGRQSSPTGAVSVKSEGGEDQGGGGAGRGNTACPSRCKTKSTLKPQLKVDEEKEPQIESIQDSNVCGQCGPVPVLM